MVGHTHEDIDQRFSLISKALKRNPARTLTELEDIIVNTGMDVFKVSYVYDVKAWISPYLCEGLHNHSKSHSFR